MTQRPGLKALLLGLGLGLGLFLFLQVLPACRPDACRSLAAQAQIDITLRGIAWVAVDRIDVALQIGTERLVRSFPGPQPTFVFVFGDLDRPPRTLDVEAVARDARASPLGRGMWNGSFSPDGCNRFTVIVEPSADGGDGDGGGPGDGAGDGPGDGAGEQPMLHDGAVEDVVAPPEDATPPDSAPPVDIAPQPDGPVRWYTLVAGKCPSPASAIGGGAACSIGHTLVASHPDPSSPDTWVARCTAGQAYAKIDDLICFEDAKMPTVVTNQNCPAGSYVIGGGCDCGTQPIAATAPHTPISSWECRCKNGATPVATYSICRPGDAVLAPAQKLDPSSGSTSTVLCSGEPGPEQWLLGGGCTPDPASADFFSLDRSVPALVDTGWAIRPGWRCVTSVAGGKVRAHAMCGGPK